jgi:RND family efflux transporter MFP subunit
MSFQNAGIDALRIDRGQATRGDRRRWLLPSIVIGVLVGGAVVWWTASSSGLEVTTAIAREQAAGPAGPRTVLNGTGYVTARRAATVSSKVTGKVIEVNIEEGMKVEEGQVLARLDSSNVEASLRLVEAQLERSRKALEETKPNLDFAHEELKRFSGLAATKVVSESDLRRAEMEARSLSARLLRQSAEIAVAEREVAQWKQQLDDTIIRAPFAGIVTSKNAQPGEMISPMSVGGFTRTGICTIVDMSSLEIEVEVNESSINRVHPDQPVEAILVAYPEWRIPGKVIAIIPTAQRQNATVKVRVGFDQLDPRILPEMAVQVGFQSAGVEEAKTKRASVVIPKSAVHHAGDRDVVWIVRNRRAERRAITVEQIQGDDCVVSAGLNNGERVVTNAPSAIADGVRVTEKNR